MFSCECEVACLCNKTVEVVLKSDYEKLQKENEEYKKANELLQIQNAGFRAQNIEVRKENDELKKEYYKTFYSLLASEVKRCKVIEEKKEMRLEIERLRE